ncbi:hypothetical protein D3C76_900800 [compost metagenome]
MEKLFLRALLAGEELDIVDQQRIDRAIEALEFVDGIELQRLDHVGDETLRVQVDHLGIRVFLQQVVTHSMHQVGFAQADAAIKEERVVAMLGVVGDLPGSSTRQLVRLAFDEGVEGEGSIQIAGVLERTFHLNGALLGTSCRSGHHSGLRHGIEAVTRGGLDDRVDCSRFHRWGSSGLGSNVSRSSLLNVRLSQRSGYSGADGCIGRCTRRGAAAAAY